MRFNQQCERCRRVGQITWPALTAITSVACSESLKSAPQPKPGSCTCSNASCLITLPCLPSLPLRLPSPAAYMLCPTKKRRSSAVRRLAVSAVSPPSSSAAWTSLRLRSCHDGSITDGCKRGAQLPGGGLGKRPHDTQRKKAYAAAGTMPGGMQQCSNDSCGPCTQSLPHLEGQDALLHTAWHRQPGHHHVTRLAQPVCTVDGLFLHRGVPPQVKQHHVVGSRQVEAKRRSPQRLGCRVGVVRGGE